VGLIGGWRGHGGRGVDGRRDGDGGTVDEFQIEWPAWVVRLTGLNGANRVRPADLPGAEEGAQTRDESPFPSIKKSQVLDHGGVIGTSAGKFLSL
jgi:hypothetical protein